MWRPSKAATIVVLSAVAFLVIVSLVLTIYVYAQAQKYPLVRAHDRSVLNPWRETTTAHQLFITYAESDPLFRYEGRHRISNDELTERSATRIVVTAFLIFCLVWPVFSGLVYMRLQGTAKSILHGVILAFFLSIAYAFVQYSYFYQYLGVDMPGVDLTTGIELIGYPINAAMVGTLVAVAGWVWYRFHVPNTVK